MKILNLNSLIYSRTGITLDWDLVVEDTDLSLLMTLVERSGSPTGPFDQIGSLDLQKQGHYLDEIPDLLGVQGLQLDTHPLVADNRLYYRLRTVLRLDPGTTFHLSEVSQSEGQLDLIAAEVLRQNRIRVEGLNGRPSLEGIRVTVYKQRFQGVRCEDCFDPHRNAIVVSNCESCMGTGYEVGYYNPTTTYASLSPNPRAIKLAQFGELEENESIMFFLNFPILRPRDIIVEPSERHWRVVSINRTERKRVVLHQMVRLYELKRNTVEYQLLHEDSPGPRR